MLVASEHGSLGIVVARRVHVPGVALQESNGASLLQHWGAAAEASATDGHFFDLKNVDENASVHLAIFYTYHVAHKCHVQGHSVNSFQTIGESVDFSVVAARRNSDVDGRAHWVGVDAPIGNGGSALRNVLLEQIFYRRILLYLN